MEIDLNKELVTHYCFYGAVLMLKMVVLSPLTGFVRFKNKSLISSEDSFFMPNADSA